MPRKIGYSTYSENFQGGDITADEWEFIQAVAAYQKRWGRRYPSWREVLHIARALGYRKVAGPVPLENPPTQAEVELAAKAKKSRPRKKKADAPTPPPAELPLPDADAPAGPG